MDAEHVAGERFKIIKVQVHAQRLGHIVQIGFAVNAPDAARKPDDIRLPLFFLFGQIAEELFDNVVQGDQSQRHRRIRRERWRCTCGAASSLRSSSSAVLLSATNSGLSTA